MNISCLWAQGDRKRYVPTTGMLILLLLLHCPWSGLAPAPTSSTTQTFSRWSVQAGFGNQTVGFPFQNFAAGFNPAITDVGVDFRLNKNPRHAFSIGLANTCLFNEVTGNALIINLDIAYRYIHKRGPYAGIGLDIGNGILFHSANGYALDRETGTYSSTSNQFSTGYSGFQLSLGYDMEPQHGMGLSFFLRNKFGIHSPYFSADLFPILPINILAVGVSYRIKKRKS